MAVSFVRRSAAPVGVRRQSNAPSDAPSNGQAGGPSGGPSGRTYSVGVAKVPGAGREATATRHSTTEPRSAGGAARVVATDTGHADKGHADARRSAANAERQGLTRRLFGGSGRVTGVDTARGLGVVLLVAGLAALCVSGASMQSVGTLPGSGLGLPTGTDAGTSLPTGTGDSNGITTGIQLLDPSTWPALWGSGSLLVLAGVVFALVAGGSASLLSGGYEGLDGVPQLRARLRTLARSVIFLLSGFGVLTAGYLVGEFGSGAWQGLSLTPSSPAPSGHFAAVVALSVPAALFSGGLLSYVGLLTLAELAFARCGSALLFTIAGACALVTPTAAMVVFQSSRTLVMNGFAAVLPWVCLFLAGMAIARLRLDLLSTRFMLLAGGVVLALLGFGGAWVLGRFVTLPANWPALFLPNGAADALPNAAANGFASFVASAPPSAFVVVGLGGVGLALVAACLLVGTSLRWLLLPLSAAGTLALSIGGIAVAVSCTVAVAAAGSPVATWFVGAATAVDTIRVPGARLHWLLPATIVAGTLAVAALWRLAFGAGLLERLCSGVSNFSGRSILIDTLSPAAQQAQATEASTGDPERIAGPAEEAQLSGAPAGTFPSAAPTPSNTNRDHNSLPAPTEPIVRPTPAPAVAATPRRPESTMPGRSAPVESPSPVPTEPVQPAPARAAERVEASPPARSAIPSNTNSASPLRSDADPPSAVPNPPNPPNPETSPRTPPVISPVRSTWSPGQTLGRLPY